MASIHKREGTKNWSCCFSLPSGKRVYRSTGTSSRAEAMRVACDIERDELAKVGAQANSQGEIVSKLQEANALALRGELSMDRARELLARIVAKSTGKVMKFYTIREWASEWLHGKRGSTAASTHANYTRFVKGFVSFLGPAADHSLDHLDEAAIRGFRDDLRENGRKAKTCNQAVKVLRTWLRAAVRQSLLARSPASEVPLLLESDSIERIPFDSSELKAILNVTEGAWRGAFLLGLYGGLRISDAANLRWSSIDGESQSIRYRPLKTARKKTEVVLPLHPAVQKYLKTRSLPLDPSSFVFPELAGRGTGGLTGLSREFIEIMEKAGVERERERVEVDGTRVVDGSRSFHSLRHTFASMLAQGGVSEGMRMELAGHKTPDMARHYTHHELETLRAAVGTLPSFK